jgi:hypothetical protein
MTYEVVESAGGPGEWRVEAIDHEGEGVVYVAIFSGPRAKERAREYAIWKKSALIFKRQRPTRFCDNLIYAHLWT